MPVSMIPTFTPWPMVLSQAAGALTLFTPHCISLGFTAALGAAGKGIEPVYSPEPIALKEVFIYNRGSAEGASSIHFITRSSSTMPTCGQARMAESATLSGNSMATEFISGRSLTILPPSFSRPARPSRAEAPGPNETIFWEAWEFKDRTEASRNAAPNSLNLFTTPP